MNLPSININFILCTLKKIFRCILVFSLYGNFLSPFVYVIIFCVGAGITTLMSILTEWTRNFSDEKWKRRGP